MELENWNYGRMFKSLLFDMDGVLIDSMAYHHEAFNQSLSTFGINVSIQDIGGRSTIEVMTELLEDRCSIEQIRDVATTKSKISLQLMKAAGKSLLVNGAVDVLERLSKGYVLALCTSASPQSVEFVLDSILPKKYFNAIVSAAMVAKPKPKPDIYLRAMEMLAVSSSQCLVVEDSLSGVQAGLAAGCDVAFISTQDRNHFVDNANVMRIHSLDQLPSLLGMKF